MQQLRRKYRNNTKVALLQTAIGEADGEGELMLCDSHTLSSMSKEWVHIVRASGRFSGFRWESKFGGASGLFGGGGYLSSADSGDWCFGTGDFTIDFWVRFNALPAAGYSMFICGQFVDANNRWGFWIENVAGTYKSILGIAVSSWTQLPQTVSLATNTWHHMAIVRNGNNWYHFLGGTQQGSTTVNSVNMVDFAGEFRVGTNYPLTSDYLNGWLDELRVSKGVARWTSNFTPPASAHTGDSNTVLLLHMDGADGSTTFSDGY